MAGQESAAQIAGWIAGGLIALGMTACTPRTPLTREEFLAETTRVYPGKAPAEVMTAAEDLLRLADPRTQFQYRDDGFTAYRPLVVFAVIAMVTGTVTVDFKAAPADDGGTKATVAMGVLAAGSAVMPTGSGGYSLAPTGTAGAPPAGNHAYRLFWQRMNHLLGDGDRWVACYDTPFKLNDADAIWGSAEALCAGAPDKLPPKTAQ